MFAKTKAYGVPMSDILRTMMNSGHTVFTTVIDSFGIYTPSEYPPQRARRRHRKYGNFPLSKAWGIRGRSRDESSTVQELEGSFT